MTVDDARHALHFVGDPQGWQPGSFTSVLMIAIMRADDENTRRLWRGFPGMVQALSLTGTEDGRQELYRVCGVQK